MPFRTPGNFLFSGFTSSKAVLSPFPLQWPSQARACGLRCYHPRPWRKPQAGPVALSHQGVLPESKKAEVCHLQCRAPHPKTGHPAEGLLPSSTFHPKKEKKKNPATHTSVIYLVRTLKHRGVEYPAQSHTATGAVQRGESREGCKCSALQRPQACFPGPSGSTSDRPALPACGPVWEGSQGASELSARLHINLHFILTMVPQDRWRHSTVFFLS